MRFIDRYSIRNQPVTPFTNDHASDNLDKQKEALKVIADFADRLCNKVPLSGNSENIELSGSAKVELNSILKKIVDLGVEGAAKYQKSEYANVLQKDLAALLKDSSKCKLEVFKDLKEKLLPTDPESPAPQPVQTRQDCGEHWSGWVDVGGAVGNPCPAGCSRGREVGQSYRSVGFPPRPQTKHKFLCWRP